MHSHLSFRTVGAGDGALLKALTRQSVEDAPYAFGGAETLADVAARSDQVWQTLAAECAGLVPEWQGRCVGFIVEDGPTACAKKAVVRLFPGTAGLQCADVSRDGSWVLGGDSTGRVLVSRLADPTTSMELHMPRVKGSATSACFGPDDGSVVVVGTSEGLVLKWERVAGAASAPSR